MKTALRSFFGPATALALTLAATAPALMTDDASAAAGKLEVRNKEIQESGGDWQIKIRIDLPKAPSMLSVPMDVTFTKVMIYERAIMEKGKAPVLNKLRVDPAQSQSFSMIVHFADTNGKVFKSTNYEFPVKRKSGFFEAGEYLMKISSADYGEIGVAQRVVLNGENEPVYRGPIEFIEKVGDAGTVAKKDEDFKAPENPDVAPIGSGGSLIPASAYEKTPEEELKARPKGCGCDIPSNPGSPTLAWTAVGLGALLAASRRRSRK